MIRIGSGLDIHKITDGNALVIGGITVSKEKKFVAHSDGDILVHALIDALLGAAGLKDIGTYFPDSDNEFKNVDSLNVLLPKVIMMMTDLDWQIVNVDANIILESPKLAPFVDNIKDNLAHVLQIDKSLISLKAKRTEKCLFKDEDEAGMAFVTLLLEKKKG